MYRTDDYRLAPMQHGMLFHSISAPAAGFYVAQVTCRLPGGTDLRAFEQAWQHVVQRHAILRTSFIWEDPSGPLQRVHAEVPIPIEVNDWVGMAEERQEKELELFLAADRSRGFDLSAPPLMRFFLFRSAQKEHLFVWSHHHALLDGRARVLVLKEVSKFYEAFRQRQSIELAASPPYKDYVDWLHCQDYTDAKLYWREILRGYSSSSSMTELFKADRVDFFDRCGAHPVRILSGWVEAIGQITQKLKVTPAMVLQAAWCVTLGRYTGEKDIIFGETRACRRRFQGAASVVGVLINTVPVRLSVDEENSFLGLLQALRDQHLRMREFENLPLSEILLGNRMITNAALFETIVVIEERTLDAALAREGCALWKGIRRSSPGHYSLALAGFLKPELSLEIAYDRFAFSDDVAHGIARQFEAVLETLTATPSARLRDLLLLSKDDACRIKEWSTTGTCLPERETIAQLFEQQVKKTPDAVAVAFANQEMSYRELNRQANQLAHYLRSIGIHSEARVGLWMERSVEMIVSMLAIMKAGGVCVALDNRYPRERISYMLDDSRAQVLVTHTKYQEQLPHYDGRIIYSDHDLSGGGDWSFEDPVGVGDGENLSYIVYTSGSTGLPKGVGITQGGIVRLVTKPGYLKFDNTQVFLQLASASFDALFFETWGSLLNGARLAVMPPGTPSLEELGEALKRYKVTTLWLTAGLFHEMVSHQLDVLRGLKQLLAGGDVLSVLHVEKFLEDAEDGACLINGYGPTENTTFTSCHRMEKKMRIVDRVPIGRPITNTTVYLLDEALRPVPLGGAGELYIGGNGLARGYTSAALTAERFIPDAVSGDSGARLYRTGDRARWRADGTLDFLGRLDNQVKIRGYRVEPEEVQNALQTCEGVREAVVVVQQQFQDKRLVAFVTTAGNQHADPASLRKALQQRVPEYLIPSAFVVLERLPLTANGKVDRRMLAALDTTGQQEAKFIGPRNSVEELLAVIWADLLKLERVSIDISFFDLGGHSLLAMQLRSRIRVTFGLEIDLRRLLQAPTIADLAEYIHTKKGTGSARSFLPIERRLHQEEAPLSFAQQRLWFLRQFAPKAVHYNIPVILHLSGPLNPGILEKAIEQIISRHEILRTTFKDNDGDLLQVIHPPQKLELTLVDLQDVPEDQLQSHLERQMKEFGRRPFDLTSDMPLRAALLSSGPHTNTLIMVMHHIAADGWSMVVFIRELIAFYQAFSGGHSSPLPDLLVQYADYAIWEKQWLQAEVLVKELEFWKNRLAGSSGVLELPACHSRPLVQKHNGARWFFSISGDLRNDLRQLGKQQGFTLHMGLSAAFAALLHLYAGKDDILIGTPVAGRNREEIEPLIGFFVNTVVLRSDLSKAPALNQLLQQMRETTLDAYAHQDLPFEKLVTELQPKRDLSRQPLVQVMIVLQDELPEQRITDDVIVRPAIPDNGTAKMDLILLFMEAPQGIQGILEYDIGLFDHPMMERLAGHFRAVLSTMVQAPQTSVKEIPLLSETERTQLLNWNKIQAKIETTGTLHHLFEKQADYSPEAVALVCEGQSATYAELNKRANQLSHYLRNLDVKPDVRVGIYMDRSLEMVVAILGVLKAGGAYVPLDPGCPAERLQFMVEDATVQWLLTEHSLLPRLPQSDARVLALELHWDEIAGQSITNPTPTATTSNIAYVIYTSGSTGKPKGVMVTHANVVCLLNSAQEHYCFSSTDIWTLFHSYTFDFSVWEIWGALAFGGLLEVVPFHVARSPEDFYQLVHTKRVTVLNQTPSAFEQFIQQDVQQNKDLHLRCIIFGGEELVFRRLAPWFERHPETRPAMVNMFGITETTVHVTLHQLQKNDMLRNASLIGRPIPGWQVYILDESMQMLPVAVPGEMYVGGAGLARGYLNRPKLTAERFVPNPFNDAVGKRLYRTGDRARFRTDGTLEYMGRIDHQIKLRGYRIELAEIESALERYPQIIKAVVAVREDATGDKGLVAYIMQVKNVEGLKTGDIKSYLRKQLPDYMVPGTVVPVDRFPLTVNGKIDHQALLSLAAIESAEEDYVAPRTTAEQVIGTIWSEVLNLDQLEIDSNFFDLGGHSLLAVKVASRIRAAFQVQIPMRNLFEHPVLSDLAAHVISLRNNQQSESISSICRISRTGELPLSFNQEGRLFLELVERLRNAPARPFHIVFGLRLQGDLKVEALKYALNGIVKRHEILRMTFEYQPVRDVEGLLFSVLQPGISQGASFGRKLEGIAQLGSMLFKTKIHGNVSIHISLEDFSGFDGAQLQVELTALVDREAQMPFDYSQPPLMRANLLKTGEQDHLLLITAHHMVSDQWSIDVFRKEFVHLYNTCLDTSLGSMNGVLPVQYVDFSAWQRDYLNPQKLQAMVAYWKKRWSEFSLFDIRSLPFASPVPLQSAGVSGMEKLVMNESLSRDLYCFVRSKNLTLNVVLLAALNVLLHCYTGKRRIGIWGHFANRIHPEVENLIGWFANNHLLGVDVGPDDQVDHVIQTALNTVLDADAHQDVPFPILWMAALREAADQTETDVQPPPYLCFDFKAEVFQPDAADRLIVEQVHLPGHGLHLALYLTARASQGRMTVSAYYSASVFSSGSMQSFLQDWQQVLESLIAAPTKRISDLPALSERSAVTACSSR